MRTIRPTRFTSRPRGSTPSPSAGGALIPAVLLGIFIYWGWDSGVAVNEESRDRNRGPGKAAVISTLILLLIYVLVTAAGQAYHGTDFLASPNNQNDVLNALGKAVFGSPLDKLLIIAVLTSASASTQTTILPTARTTLSMAKWHAIPSSFGRDSPALSSPPASRRSSWASYRPSGRWRCSHSTRTRTCSGTRFRRSASRSASTMASPASHVRSTTARSCSRAPATSSSPA